MQRLLAALTASGVGSAFYMNAELHGAERLTAFHIGVDELRQYETYRAWLDEELTMALGNFASCSILMS